MKRMSKRCRKTVRERWLMGSMEAVAETRGAIWDTSALATVKRRRQKGGKNTSCSTDKERGTRRTLSKSPEAVRCGTNQICILTAHVKKKSRSTFLPQL